MLNLRYIKADEIKKRQYQFEDAESLIKSLTEGKNSGLVYPTGAGKTITAFLVADYFLQFGKVLVLAPTEVLCDQHSFDARKIFDFNNPGKEVRKLTGRFSKKKRPLIWQEGKIVVATPQTIISEIENQRLVLSKDELALVVIDEMHMANKKYAYVAIAKLCLKLNIPILGLTASTGKKKQLKTLKDNYDLQWWVYRSSQDEQLKKFIFPKEEKQVIIDYPKLHLAAMSFLRHKLLRVHNKFARSGLIEGIKPVDNLDRRISFYRVTELNEIYPNLQKWVELKRLEADRRQNLAGVDLNYLFLIDKIVLANLERFLQNKLAADVLTPKELEAYAFLKKRVAQNRKRKTKIYSTSNSWKYFVLYGAYYRLIHLLNLFVTESYQLSLAYLRKLEQELNFLPEYKRKPYRKYQYNAAAEILENDHVFGRFKASLVYFVEENRVLHPKLRKCLELIDDHLKLGDKVLVFDNYKDSLDVLKRELNTKGVRSEVIAGNKHMKTKERSSLIKRFKNGDFSVLLATSALEAGIHIPKIDVVIHYSMPPTGRSKIQRGGRAGRTKVGIIYFLIMENSNDSSLYFASRSENIKMHIELTRLLKLQQRNLEGVDTSLALAEQKNLGLEHVDLKTLKHKRKYAHDYDPKLKESRRLNRELEVARQLSLQLES